MRQMSVLLLFSLLNTGTFAAGVGVSTQLAPASAPQSKPMPTAESVAERIVFLRGQEVWMANSRGQQLRRLTRFERQFPVSPSLSPDGTQVVFSVDEEEQPALGQVQLLDTKEANPRPIAYQGVHSAHTPAFMPDGATLALVVAKHYRQQGENTLADLSVALGAASGGEVRSLVNEQNVMLDAGHAFTDPSPSPDGKFLAYQLSGSDVSGGFVIVDAVSGQQLLRFPQDAGDYRPYWRPRFDPSANMILCYSPSTDVSSSSQILLVDRRQAAARLVTEGLNPSFVDGGRAIVFERWRQQGEQTFSDLWRLELRAGAQAERIVENGSQPSGVTLHGVMANPELEGYFQGLAPLQPLPVSSEQGQDSAPQAEGTQEEGDRCEALWYQRNRIYADKGFCFTTSKAVQTFGKGCFPPYGKLGPAEQAQVDEIEAEEVREGCR